MTPETLVTMALAAPLAGAIVVAVLGRNVNDADHTFRTAVNIRDGAALTASLVTFGLVLALLEHVQAGSRPSVEVIHVLPGVPLMFEVEPLGMLFALVAAGLWIPTSIYAFGYMRKHPRIRSEASQTRFFACFAVAIFAALGIAFAGNLLTLFLFYELLTFSTYPLVTHAGTDKARRAGRVYLGVLLFTSVAFFLSAILLTAHFTAGDLSFRTGGILAGRVEGAPVFVLLGLFVFGTGKAALMPFHRWLPAAMVAPTPVSALLHAVAVVKAGVFTVLKIVVYIFGIDFLQTGGYSTWLCWVAAITILAGSVIALTRDNLKIRLAYSTVSQLGCIVLGAALATPAALLGGGLHLAMHAMGKITLFFCAGSLIVFARKTEISTMDGVGRRMPWTMAAFFVSSLSIIGLPPLGGSWSKMFLAAGAADGGQTVFMAVLMLSSLLSAGYLLPVVARAFFRPPSSGDGGTQQDAPSEFGEGAALCTVPLIVTAAGCGALFVWGGFMRELLVPILEAS